MRVIRGHYILFGLALAALVALGTAWAVYFRHAAELESRAALNELAHVSVAIALMLGQADSPPPLGPIQDDARFQVVPSGERRPGDLFSPLVPRYLEIGIRPDPALLTAIRSKAARRQIQFVGEGSLLFVLIGVCIAMLFTLIRSDRKQMRAIEAFISTVTHEMKTPLAGVKSLLQTFQAGRIPPGQESTLYAMGLKEIERLEHMVENVLISGRLRTEGYQMEVEPVALRRLLDSFLEHRRHYLAGRSESIIFRWEPAEAELQVRCDPQALSVVLDNLTDNALKYGGENPEVTVRVRRAPGGVEVGVEDHGIGFDPAQAEKLFEPFHRAAAARDGVHHGTGLGLSISRALVERMEGTLRAAGRGPDRGSRFVVTLREA
jgi:signal transduction histidine kinase